MTEPAHGTFLHRTAPLDFLRGTESEKQIGQGKPGWVGNPFFFRAALAEVHLLHLAFDDLGEKNRGLILLTNIAVHGRARGAWPPSGNRFNNAA